LCFKCRYGIDTGSAVLNLLLFSNDVGILDGKHNMAAMENTLKLCADSSRTSFALRKKPLRIVEIGPHFLARLAKPRLFSANEKGLAVVKQDLGTSLHTVVVSATTHFAKPDIGCEPTLYTNDFRELKPER
jgi:hypothetical protein